MQSALRNGLAMGADSAVHLKDPLFDGLDTPGHGAGRWRRRSSRSAPTSILTGQQGVGGDNSQVPGLLAEILDLPQVTMAVKIEIRTARRRCEREIEGAHETWETTLPAVISAQKGLNEPRYASLKGIMAAKKKPIDDQGRGRAGPEGGGPRAEDDASCRLELPAARGRR